MSFSLAASFFFISVTWCQQHPTGQYHELVAGTPLNPYHIIPFASRGRERGRESGREEEEGGREKREGEKRR
eukprot:203538-Rhodomonas_salina.1